MQGMVSFSRAFGLAHRLSTESRSTPGIDGTGCRALLPVHHEQRPDQVVGRERVLRAPGGAPTRAAVAAHAHGQVERIACDLACFRLGRTKRIVRFDGRPNLIAMGVSRGLFLAGPGRTCHPVWQAVSTCPQDALRLELFLAQIGVHNHLC